MANIKEYIKKVMDGTVSLEEQQAALAQVEKTIVEAKQRRDESVGQKADMVVQALKTIEAKLEAKLVELNNTPAMQGVQGPTGKAGKDGVDGKDGLNGVSGKDGKDGKDGVDGKDGISVVDAKIDFDGSLVVYLSNGDEIDCGQILSPDVAQNIIINSGGSGTSQAVTDTIASLQAQINALTGIDGTLGTMAQQDANAVAITGGTINGTTIGATTPSTVNATTITGQTETINGTGMNLVIYSQNYAFWNPAALSVTANSTTAPDLTNTGSLLTSNGATTQHYITQAGTAGTVSSFYPRTWSCYLKAGTNNFAQLLFGSDINGYANFNLSTGVLGTVGSSVTATITDAGSGWYRCSITTSSTTAGSSVYVAIVTGTTAARFESNSLSTTIYAWGAQFEYGSTARAYVVTTTPIVYNAPQLQFNNSPILQLQSDGAVVVQPAGTGALQAQATTSTTAGGNARGANAVDFQTSRSNAARVASGQGSAILGGNDNTASGVNGVVAGGAFHTASGLSSYVGGGKINTASGSYTFIGSGDTNTAAGFYNFIGGGQFNSGTALAAVTTQSATMNGTTAVTLSGSNANIRVGQLISGTSISFADTYVAAISGTSLTLSKNASGSSTSTLSFYTPHGVVVGGGNNQATGSYSFIGGGGDAGTAANRNVASGDWSFVGGGIKNVASGIGSFIGGGGVIGDGSVYTNTANGNGSFIGGGISNTTSGTGSVVVGGYNNTANANYSSIAGGYNGTTRSIQGNFVMTACLGPISTAAQGIHQTALLVLAVQTTDATATVLRSNSSAAATTNQVTLPNNSAYFFTGEVISGVTGGGDTKGWTIEGVIKRGANAAATALVGTPTVTSLYANAGAATWTIAVTANTTLGCLTVTFTGAAATTIRTVCQIRTTEMTY
jgi:hypothetical protein